MTNNLQLDVTSEIFPKLYKLDSTGRLRIWRMELSGDKYRTVSGLADGQQVTSGWVTAVPASQDTAEKQALFEVDAKYRHQLAREYHSTPDTVSTPNFFEPMLAKKFEGWPGQCWAQPKLDGIRCIARAEGLFSRQGQPITAVPHIQQALAYLFENDPDLVLDGELYNHEFHDDFGEISSIVRKKNPTSEQLEKAKRLMQFHVYDLPSHPGSFGERSAALALLVSDCDKLCIRFVPTAQVNSSENLDLLYGQWLEEGWEGQMVRLDAPYEQKRSKTLLKRKEMQDAEFECVSIEEGNGNWAGLAKRVTCRLPDGRTFGAGIKGNAIRAKELLTETHNVVTVQYFMLSPDGVPRFPVVTKFHGSERTL
jgi:DNA ligase-1